MLDTQERFRRAQVEEMEFRKFLHSMNITRSEFLEIVDTFDFHWEDGVFFGITLKDTNMLKLIKYVVRRKNETE